MNGHFIIKCMIEHQQSTEWICFIDDLQVYFVFVIHEPRLSVSSSD